VTTTLDKMTIDFAAGAHYRHLFEAVGIVTLCLLIALLVESELLRARSETGEAASRGWLTAIAPLTIVFFIVVVLRLVRFS
jgi:hypothetical protein